jgi:hypothetical protein
MQNKKADVLLSGSKRVEELVTGYIMKLILGPNYESSPLYDLRKHELETGLLDDYQVLVYLQSNQFEQNSAVQTAMQMKQNAQFNAEVEKDVKFTHVITK